MKNYLKLLDIAKRNNGYIFSSDIAKLNVPKDYLKFVIKIM